MPHRAPIAIVAVAAIGALGWLAWPRGEPPGAGTVRIVQHPAAPMPPAATPSPVSLVEKPPPPLPSATPPDAFAGSWSAPDGRRLAIARTAPDRYEVKLSEGSSTQSYDGVFEKGSIQLTIGIDGTWVQLADTSARPCVKLGDDALFCRG